MYREVISFEKKNKLSSAYVQVKYTKVERLGGFGVVTTFEKPKPEGTLPEEQLLLFIRKALFKPINFHSLKAHFKTKTENTFTKIKYNMCSLVRTLNFLSFHKIFYNVDFIQQRENFPFCTVAFSSFSFLVK